MTSETIWFFSIILTILIWGTWLIYSRKAAEELSNPFFENVLITLGALLCNTIIFIVYLLYSGISFDVTLFLFPFLSGILWAFAGLFAFISISKIWVWKAMSIWAPSWMVVSFLWGILYYKEFTWNIILASLAITIIIAWVISVIQIRNSHDTQKLMLSWAFFAFLSSLIWGWTYLIPIKELSSEISPFITLLPLSIGMCFWAIGIFLVKSEAKIVTLENFRKGKLIILSWFMWGIGNLFAIIAVLNIGIGKAYPMAELCGIINAIFAIFILKEIQDPKKIKLFLLATLISFAWAIWLSILKI